MWINTPELGKEACGTSGVKACLNGALQCSVADGWVDEVDWKDNAWMLSEDKTEDDLYGYLENEIPNKFYDRDERGIPQSLIGSMKETMKIADSGFTAKRMLKDYVERIYSLGDIVV